jgi:hypothetical protein
VQVLEEVVVAEQKPNEPNRLPLDLVIAKPGQMRGTRK